MHIIDTAHSVLLIFNLDKNFQRQNINEDTIKKKVTKVTKCQDLGFKIEKGAHPSSCTSLAQPANNTTISATEINFNISDPS